MSNLERVIALAKQPGPVRGPTKLLNAVAQHPVPAHALQMGTLETLYPNFSSEFPFLQRLDTHRGNLSGQTLQQWAALIRWILETLQTWSLNTDRKRVDLACVIICAQASDLDGSFWRLMPAEAGANQEVVTAMTDALRGCSIGFRVKRALPVWLATKMNVFAQGLKRKDWDLIGGTLPFLDEITLHQVLTIQAARFLARYHLEGLIEATRSIEDVLALLTVVRAVPLYASLRIGNAVKQLFAAFACLYDLERFRNVEQYSQDAEPHLVAFLSGVTRHRTLWDSFIRSLNGEPQKHFWLHGPIGTVLAKAPRRAVKQYADSVRLVLRPQADLDRRNAVAECLSHFRKNAGLGRRRLLWRRAHKRWRAWNFGLGRGQLAKNIVHCDLDYALVGYAAECMNAAQRDKVKRDVIAALIAHQEAWFVSSAALASEWFRIMSVYQPYGLAIRAFELRRDFWDPTGEVGPFTFSSNEYYVLRSNGHGR